MTSFYAENLADSLGLVIQQSIDHRNFMDEFLACIKYRIAAEQHYAKQLSTIGDTLDKHLAKPELSKTSIGFLFAALKSDITRRTFQVQSFSQHLRAEILNPTKQLSQSQAAEFKKLQKQGKSLDKQFREIQQRLAASKERVSNVSRQFQQQFIKNEITKVRCIYTLEEKQRQYNKIAELKLEKTMNETACREATQDYNTFMSDSRKELLVVLSKFQTQLIQRTEKLTDNLKKLMIFETAMMRNFDYDIINISNQLEIVNPRKDILLLVEEGKKTVKPQVKIQNSGSRMWMDALVEQIEDKEFERKVQFEKNQQTRLFIQDYIRDAQIRLPEGYDGFQIQAFKQVVEAVDACWKNRTVDEVSMERFRKLIDGDENRYIFHVAFKQYNAFFNREMSKQSADLFQIVIEKSIEKKDIYTIRKLLTIIFGKWVAKEPNSKPRQLILYRGIQANQLWKNQDFWDAAIFQSIQENLKGLVNQKGETLEETKIKQQNTILSQLACYCHIMMMLGSAKKSVKLSVGKYCRLHSLGQHENEVLSKTIDEALVTYKEFN